MVPLDENVPLPAAPAPDELSRMELRGVLTEAVATLSESERTVIVLRYMSDLSYQEMSAFLEIPLSTVKKRLHDARKGLLRWFTSAAAGDRARAVLRDYRPSRDTRLEQRVMTLTAFLHDVMRGNTAAVATALDAQPELLDAKGAWKPLWTGTANALYVAALSGRADIVRLLLSRGARLEPDSPADISPLVGAAIEGRVDVATILLDAGAQVDIFAACALGDAARATSLLAQQPRRWLVRGWRTARRRSTFVAVSKWPPASSAPAPRPDLDAVDDAGLTPLQWISLTGRYKAVCHYLIAQGATADSSDIFTACSCGDIATVTTLIDGIPLWFQPTSRADQGFRARPSARRPYTWPPVAANRRSWRCSSDAARTSTLARGEHAIAPLHAAAAGGHTHVAETLIAAGADVHLRDGAFGATPEEWARFFGHDDFADATEASHAMMPRCHWLVGTSPL